MKPAGDIMDIKDFKFDDKGLVCAIAQDATTGQVLMQAYMNAEALQATLDSGYATYFSRSRQCLWKKGETSGHLQKVVRVDYDCDADCVLLQVDQTGAACHTGNRSCFYRNLKTFEDRPDYKIIFAEAAAVEDRKAHPVEGSYTNYLLGKGTEKICKKVGEEATETVIAACCDKRGEMVGELCDLFYHALVLMADKDVCLDDVFAELERRRGKAPDPKYAKGNIATNTDMIKEKK